MKPRIPITSPDFRYRCAHTTDVAKTWREHRKRMESEKAKREDIVRQLPRKQA